MPALGRALAAAALGALAALALAPLHWLPLLFVAFGGLVLLLDRAPGPRGAALSGWLFGLGHFLAGLGWIAESFQVDAERFGALAAPAVLGLGAFLALFPALACLAAKAVGRKGWPLVPALAACWGAAEWARGHALTGFPWNLVGYAWGVSDATLQPASVVGVYGLGFVTVVLAALPGLALLPARAGGGRRWWSLAASMAGILALWALGAARLAGAGAGDPDVPGVRLRLVQASVPQAMKWAPDERARILARHIALTTAPAAREPTHVVWPESAVPYLLAEAPEVRRAIGAAVPAGGALVTGAVRRAPGFAARPAYLNSLVALDGTGEVAAAYDKTRLVPFGEYVPLRGLLPLKKFTEGAVDFAPGAGPASLAVPGLPPARPMICYEAVFPVSAAAGAAAGPAGWLLNVTNDAWFGTSAGPYQHFLAARVRAVEQGLPLVRAANTGISAVVDAHGRVRASLPLNVEGVLDQPLPAPARGGTPYAVWGDAPFAALVALGLAFAALARRPRMIPGFGAPATAPPRS